MKKVLTSAKFYLHGFFVAAGSAFLGTLFSCIQTGALPTSDQLKAAAIIGVSAGIAYLSKVLIAGPSTGTEQK